MNGPEWSPLLINGPGVVIVLYWAPEGSCDIIVIQVVYWVELLEQRRLFPIFVKIWIAINGT